MLGRFLQRVGSRTPAYHFATAVTRDAVDYYRILEVPAGATETAIRKAYAELTNHLDPQLDSRTYRQLNEAFVILTNNKTRDAYDSLLHVRKQNYLSPDPETTPSTQSYLASRKAQKYLPTHSGRANSTKRSTLTSSAGTRAASLARTQSSGATPSTRPAKWLRRMR